MSSTRAPRGVSAHPAAPFVTAAVALLGAGCSGPTDRQLASAALVSSPAALALSVALLALLVRLWRPLRGDLAPRWRAVVAVAALYALMAAFGRLAGGSSFDSGLAVLGAWVLGASVAALALLVWRVAVRVAPERSFLAAVLVPAAVMYPPAIYVLVRPGASVPPVFIVLWMYSGVGGLMPLALLLGLLIEVALRRRRLHRATE